MKGVSEITACVVDYGTFESLAVKLGETMGKVYFYSPNEDEYREITRCTIGVGIDDDQHRVTRVDEFMSPRVVNETDLFIFPDIGWGETQSYLRSIGKAVWGSMGADNLELYRTRFLDLLKRVGLPIVPSKQIVGMTSLAEYLKDVKNKWVKINRFRNNMETWHHIDWQHSERMLEHLAVEFGATKELVVFVVQDDIESDLEIGYDGWTVDGQYPDSSYQGYEKKNELYLGSQTKYTDLPEEIRFVNEKLSSTLKEYQYRNFFATEIRLKDKTPYFIDPTMRMPGQTGEQLLETCVNLADVIWQGANGNLIKPEFKYKFAAEATLHYTDCPDIWMTVRIPKEILQWVKLYHYCYLDGAYHCPPGRNDEIGVVLGVGNTIEEAIDHLKANLKVLKDEPVCAHTDKFADLLEEAKQAREEGSGFAHGKIPGPETILTKKYAGDGGI